MDKVRLKQQQLTNQNMKNYFQDAGQNTANTTTNFGATEVRGTIVAT